MHDFSVYAALQYHVISFNSEEKFACHLELSHHALHHFIAVGKKMC